jgi:resuscitation-promoting factor RpfB
MRLLLQHTSLYYALLAALLFGLAAFSALMIPKAHALNGGERLFMIHDRGIERGIISDAASLREVLDEAEITLDQNDRIEPGLDEELVTNQYQVNIYRARPIMIVDGSVRQLVMSAYQTPKQIAAHAGIELRDEDEAKVGLSQNFISDGASIRMSINRATPVKLQLYGKADTVYTQAVTVAEFLTEKSIKLGKNDDMSHQSSDPITNAMQLSIWRNGKQTVTQEEPVKFGVKQVQDANREVGYRVVDTPGKNGKKMVTYEVIMKDGQEVSRKVIQSVVTEKPVVQVETVGSKPSFSGGFAEALTKLRACESGGNYANKNNPLYRGAYQFSYSTWGNKYGIYDPADASPAQQDQAARELYERRGWQPWPHCGASLPDTYR